MSLYSKTNKFLIPLGAVLTLSSLNSCLKDDFLHQHSTEVLLNINEQNSMIMSVEMMERILKTTRIAQGDCDVDSDDDNDGKNDDIDSDDDNDKTPDILIKKATMM